MNRLIIALSLCCAAAALAEPPVEAPDPATHRLPLYLVFGESDHSRSARQQWEALYGDCERSRAYQRRFSAEREYVTQRFDVRILEQHQAPVQQSYPRARFGRGGDWLPLNRHSTFPGHTPMAIHDLSRWWNHHIELREYQRACWLWHRTPWEEPGGAEADKPQKPECPDVSIWLEGAQPAELDDAPEPDEAPPAVPIH